LPGDKSDRSLLICGLKTAQSQGSRFGTSPEIRKQLYIKSMETSKKYLEYILDLNEKNRVIIFVILFGCLYRLINFQGFEMELFFICPVGNRNFSTSRWEIPGSLSIVSDHRDGKKLMGRVEVFCPYCREVHEYEPDEIPCPFELSNTPD